MINHKPCIRVLVTVQVQPGLTHSFRCQIPDYRDQVADPLAESTAYIWRVGGIMLAVAAVQVAFAVGAVYVGSRVSMASSSR